MFFGEGFPFFESEGHGMRGPKKNVDNSKFYKALEVSKDASVQEIKKAYRRLAVKHHPDKGGDPEVFKEIGRAYEVLSDPEKRRMYDDYGEEGLEGSGATDPTDIFDVFFGSSRRHSQGKRRGEDIESRMKVTLEQVYKGSMRKMAISKDVICSGCDGHGGPKEHIETCPLCNGTGVRVQMRKMGPMIQQTQTTCTSCRSGKVIPENKKCKKCNGTGTCKDKKILEVFIEKGVPDKHKIVFSGEADERPDTTPGDVRFIIDVQEHPVFKRNKSHLVITRAITLYEALVGYKISIIHLDGRKLVIESALDEVVQHGAVKMVPGEGMPIYKNPFEKGNLFIELQIIMPTPSELLLRGASLKNALKKILPVPIQPKTRDDESDVEVYTAVNATPEDMYSKSAGKERYEEEEEDGGQPHKVQCRQQ